MLKNSQRSSQGYDSSCMLLWQEILRVPCKSCRQRFLGLSGTLSALTGLCSRIFFKFNILDLATQLLQMQALLPLQGLYQTVQKPWSQSRSCVRQLALESGLQVSWCLPPLAHLSLLNSSVMFSRYYNIDYDSVQFLIGKNTANLNAAS